jgi:hypothetical protein
MGTTVWLQLYLRACISSHASMHAGGACGYDNLYNAGYGVLNAALSQVLFNDGASCGQCYSIRCDASRSVWCKPGPPRPHFDMSQPAWENIGVYRGGIIPVLYQR